MDGFVVGGRGVLDLGDRWGSHGENGGGVDALRLTLGSVPVDVLKLHFNPSHNVPPTPTTNQLTHKPPPLPHLRTSNFYLP